MLIVDEKESRSNSITRRALFDILGNDVMVDPLVTGDFAAFDTPLTMGIEHKAFNDLVGAMSSGRLDEQLSRMLESFDWPILLIDELPAPNRMGKVAVYGSRHQIQYSWVMGCIAGWSLRGITPIMVRTPGAVAPTIAALYHVAAKTEHRDTYEPRRLLNNLRPMTLTERVLVQFPGVGPDRAGKLKGLSLERLNEMTEKEWKSILGPLTGSRAWKEWHNG